MIAGKPSSRRWGAHAPEDDTTTTATLQHNNHIHDSWKPSSRRLGTYAPEDAATTTTTSLPLPLPHNTTAITNVASYTREGRTPGRAGKQAGDFFFCRRHTKFVDRSNLARRPREAACQAPKALPGARFVLPPLPRRSKPRDSVPVHRPTRCPAAVAQCCRGLRVGVCTCSARWRASGQPGLGQGAVARSRAG